ncbi:MAG: TonB-dependent receptor [Alphaproteobacteria bacterium]|nr:TonB-dependent receptor [Alphaproteobacteria bacterium]
MKKSIAGRSLFAGVASAALLCGGAWAQDQAAPADVQVAQADAGRQADDSEVITVTSERRAQNLQDVPASVTAFTTKIRDVTGIITPQQQLNFTPGVFYNPAFDRVTIRGIGRVTTQIGTDAGVAVYQDGFYVASPTNIGGSTLGTQRVEVLRGPQGTLYGRNSIGGALNAISRRPTDEVEADARISVNNYGGVTLETRVAGPIADWVSGSLRVGAVEQEEGYYKNFSNSKDEGGPESSWNVDAQLKFKFDDNFDAWIRYTTLDSTTHPRNSVGITAYGVPNRGTGVPYVFYGLPADGNPGVEDHRMFRTDRRSTATYDNYHMVIGEAVYHADGFDVKYTGGYRTYDYLLSLDGNATDNVDFQFPYDCGILVTGVENEDCDAVTPGIQRYYRTVHNDIIQDQTDDREGFSHELNITSTGDGPFQYILGAYYFEEDQSQRFSIISVDEPGNSIVNGGGANPDNTTTGHAGVAGHQGLIYEYHTLLTTKSSAIYGQLDYQFTPELKATVGLRYSYDKKEGYEDNIFIAWLVAGFPGAPTFGIPPTLFDYTVGICPSASDPASGVMDPERLDPAYACPVYRNMDDSWDAVTGTAGIEWTPNDDTLVYGKYSRGFKAGGFNLGTMLADPTVGEETVDAWEVGWKQTVDERLMFNAAAFFYQYHDQQVPVAEVQSDAATGQQIQVSVLTNLSEVENYGLEVEATWEPIDNLRFMANYSYLHAEIIKASLYADVADPLALQPEAQPVGAVVANTQQQSVVGNTPPGSPEHKFSINGSYTYESNIGDFIASATWTYRSHSFQTMFNTKQHLVEGGSLVDLRLTWNDKDSGLSIIGSVNNVFDAEVMTGFFTDSPARLSFQSLFLEPPRQFFLEVRYSY